jgi:hypothetical protein
MAIQEPRYLYGFHDPGGEQLMLDAGKPGWVLITEEVGHDPNWPGGRNYANLSSRGLGVIVRLNNGYHPNGTIPEPQYYDDFASRCANFVSNSQGCSTWIIGNEMNHSQERPHDQPITPDLYASCYLKCRQAIHARAGDDLRVIAGAVAPYNIETRYTGNEGGDWVRYFADILNRVGGACDGIALHAYTWGSDPGLIVSEERMGAPYGHRRKQFRVYRDFMESIPQSMSHLPVYITEANQGGAGGPWENAKNGWIPAAYQEIDTWNRQGGQQIHCVILYRWSTADPNKRWNISEKGNVVADFKAALAHEYRWDYAPRERFFPETGKWVRGPFLDLLNRYGQEICGRPITDQLQDGECQTQYFETVVMEEYAPGQVRLKPTGLEIRDARLRIEQLEAQAVSLEQQMADLQKQIDDLKSITPAVEVSRPPIGDIIEALPRHPSLRYRMRNMDEITHVIVHHSATLPTISAEAMARYHVNDRGWPGIGYHFVITVDGKIQQTNPLAAASYHAREANAYGVGICFTGDFSITIPSPAQLDAGAHLVAWLLQELHIPLNHVQGHKANVLTTSCPGDQWDEGQRWGDLLRAQIQALRTGMP